jgi:hypothetical protein
VAAPLDERQLAGPGDLLAEPDAARALDAARHVGDDVRADARPVVAGELPPGLGRPRDREAGRDGVVLQLALARLVADGAVERVVDQEELHRRVAAARAFSELAWTTMPSRTGTVQDAWIFGTPSISTMHIRHWPTTERRGW